MSDHHSDCSDYDADDINRETKYDLEYMLEIISKRGDTLFPKSLDHVLSHEHYISHKLLIAREAVQDLEQAIHDRLDYLDKELKNK